MCSAKEPYGDAILTGRRRALLLSLANDSRFRLQWVEAAKGVILRDRIRAIDQVALKLKPFLLKSKTQMSKGLWVFLRLLFIYKGLRLWETFART